MSNYEKLNAEKNEKAIDEINELAKESLTEEMNAVEFRNKVFNILSNNGVLCLEGE